MGGNQVILHLRPEYQGSCSCNRHKPQLPLPVYQQSPRSNLSGMAQHLARRGKQDSSDRRTEALNRGNRNDGRLLTGIQLLPLVPHSHRHHTFPVQKEQLEFYRSTFNAFFESFVSRIRIISEDGLYNSAPGYIHTRNSRLCKQFIDHTVILSRIRHCKSLF